MRRILSGLLLPAYLSSCTSWQVQPVSPEQAITEDQPSKIQLILSDSTMVEMEQPRIVGDTLRGLVKGGAEESLVERDVLLADIATVRVRKTSVNGRFYAVGIYIAATAALLALGCAINCSSVGG